jgi:hypothetical protein
MTQPQSDVVEFAAYVFLAYMAGKVLAALTIGGLLLARWLAA